MNVGTNNVNLQDVYKNFISHLALHNKFNEQFKSLVNHELFTTHYKFKQLMTQ